MLKNYFLLAIRNLVKNKTYSVINVLGLSVGIAVTLLILFYIKNEVSYDDFHKRSDDIYRISVSMLKEGKLAGESCRFVDALAPAIKDEYPEVETYTRVSASYTVPLGYKDKNIKVNQLRYADSTFFKVFNYKLVEGDLNTVLSEPYSIVLSEKTVKKLFGKKKAIGEAVEIEKSVFKITGIIKDAPKNTHISYNAIASFSSLYSMPGRYMGWNGGNQYVSYLLLKRNTDPDQLSAKLPDLMWEKINSRIKSHGYEEIVSLQPLKDIHLYYNEENSNILANIIVFSIVAFLVLLIATVNFINLSVSLSMKRIKEVSIRKVLGSSRIDLVKRYISESFYITMLSFISALFIIELVLPYYNNIMNSFISLSDIVEYKTIPGILILLALISFVAGAYPAFYLANMEIADVYKGAGTSNTGSRIVKKALIVFQFSVSIGLIIATVFISRQLDYVMSKNLGFDKENIVVFNLPDEKSKTSYQRIKEGLNQYPEIINSTVSSEVPYNNFTSNGYIPKGQEDYMMIHVVFGDNDFLITYGLNVINGRGFNEELDSDEEVYLINESLADYLDWKELDDKTIYRNNDTKVVGVVKNFNYASLHSEIEPLIISNKPEGQLYDMLSVKIRSNNIHETIDVILSEIKKYSNLDEVEYGFLDEKLQCVYMSEYRFRELFTFYSITAVVLSIIGLISLVASTTEKRAKEIGVRKVLGSSTSGLVYLLVRDYGLLLIVANVIAWPLVYLLVSKWLTDYAYRIEMSLWVFVIGGFLTSIGSLLTVMLQCIKYSSVNPVEVLRDE